MATGKVSIPNIEMEKTSQSRLKTPTESLLNSIIPPPKQFVDGGDDLESNNNKAAVVGGDNQVIASGGDDFACVKLDDKKNDDGKEDDNGGLDDAQVTCTTDEMILPSSDVFMVRFWRLNFTFIVWSAIFGIAMCNSILPCTILFLRDQYKSTTHNMAYIFSSRAMGSFIGGISSLSMATFLNQKNGKYLFPISLLVLAIATLIIPICRDINEAIGCLFLQGFSISFTMYSIFNFTVSLWRRFSFKYLQLLQVQFCFGALITPQLVWPFLQKIEFNDKNRINDTVTNTFTSLSNDDGTVGVKNKDENITDNNIRISSFFSTTMATKSISTMPTTLIANLSDGFNNLMLVNKSFQRINDTFKTQSIGSINLTTTTSSGLLSKTVYEDINEINLLLPFAMLALYVSCLSVIAIIMFIISGRKYICLLNPITSISKRTFKVSTLNDKFLVVFSSIFVFFYCGKEMGNLVLLLPHVKQYLEWDTKATLDLLTTIYTTYGIVRISATFLPMKMHRSRIIFGLAFINAFAAVLPCTFQLGHWSIWASAIFTSVSTSVMYQMLMTWMGEIMEMSLRITTCHALVYDISTVLWPMIYLTNFSMEKSDCFFIFNFANSLIILLVLCLIYIVRSQLSKTFKLTLPQSEGVGGGNGDIEFNCKNKPQISDSNLRYAYQYLSLACSVACLTSGGDFFGSMLPVPNGLWKIKGGGGGGGGAMKENCLKLKKNFGKKDEKAAGLTRNQRISKSEVIRVKKRSPAPCRSAMVQVSAQNFKKGN